MKEKIKAAIDYILDNDKAFWGVLFAFGLVIAIVHELVWCEDCWMGLQYILHTIFIAAVFPAAVSIGGMIILCGLVLINGLYDELIRGK